MNQTEVFKKLTDQIVAALDKAEAEGKPFSWKSPYQNRQTGLPKNALTGKNYRGANVIILMMIGGLSGYPVQEWVTYKQAQQLAKDKNLSEDIQKAPIKKGARATYIVFWKEIQKEPDPNLREGEMSSQDDSYWVAAAHAVFNLSQTHIPFEAPEAKTYESDAIPELDAVIDGYKNKPEIIFEGSIGRYNFGEDKVYCPPKEQFKDGVSYYGTLVHELVHSTGHATRLKRQFGKQFGDSKYTAEELVAETGTVLLFGAAGVLPTYQENFENNIAYIRTWKQNIKKHPRVFINALQQAQKAADYILNGNHAA